MGRREDFFEHFPQAHKKAKGGIPHPTYGPIIKAATGCPEDRVCDVEELVRDMVPGGCLDHLTRGELQRIAIRAWRDYEPNKQD